MWTVFKAEDSRLKHNYVKLWWKREHGRKMQIIAILR